MKYVFTCLLVLFLGLSTALAQTEPIPACGFDDVMAQRLAQSPQLKKQFDANEAVIRQYVQRARQARVAATLYTIPVVVHVIHTGGAVGTIYNPSDATIQGAITGLNNFWRKALSTSGGADIELNFALATRSPSCGSSTGINRVDGSSLTNYTANGITGSGTSGASETAVKALSKWSNLDYINIWVVNKIDGFDGTSGSGVVGYAYFPGAPSSIDGIVLVAATMNQTSVTLAHEMGHVFSLYHTFQGDGSGTTCPATETDCNTQGDNVCDTERHKRGTCVTTPTLNTCTGANYVIADATFNYTVLNNYMNYAVNSCGQMFTEGQKTRIRAALDGTRANLKNGYGFNTTTLAAPSSTLNVNPPWVSSTSGGVTTYYNCGGVTLSASTQAFVTFQWQKDGVDIPAATAGTYTATTAGAYRVVLTPCTGSVVTTNSINVGVYPTLSPTISPSTTRLCTGTTLSLSAVTDGFSSLNTYQWYKDGSPISGATGSTYNVTVAGSYRVDVTRCVTVNSATQTITVGAAPVAACTPTFTNSPGTLFGVLNLTLGGINASSSTSSGDGANYIDRSCTYTGTTTAGATVPFSVQTGNASYVKLFLDKNNDGNFVQVASIQTSGSGFVNNGSGSFVVPTGTLLNTALRLRVATSWTGYGAASIVTACGLNETVNAANGSGQIEDFAIVVTGALPVELLAFNAYKNADKSVSINWATATETDNRLFCVERSRDLIAFDTLAAVDGKGESRTRTDYALTDSRPYPGQNYYRLTQLDRTGSWHTYRPIGVLVDSDGAQLMVWPNPVPAKTFVLSQSGLATATIRIMDVLGRPVSFGREQLPGDQLRISLNGQQPAGLYRVEVQHNATAHQTVQVLVE